MKHRSIIHQLTSLIKLA